MQCSCLLCHILDPYIKHRFPALILCNVIQDVLFKKQSRNYIKRNGRLTAPQLVSPEGKHHALSLLMCVMDMLKGIARPWNRVFKSTYGARDSSCTEMDCVRCRQSTFPNSLSSFFILYILGISYAFC